ncbi:hypothetical protein EB796_008396 [Bugula neritina]|uniref:Uncharacterized protein n=1 Tax=Bugula neritina TaxID=10212 RepID=A0A7J7K560_BUGNE|nr:hypothetical protein EB796_008396 [Bugula neritina]
MCRHITRYFNKISCKEDSCTCFEKGNYYSPVSSDNCRSFTQRTAFLPAETQRCPHGLQFDVKTCVCNRPGTLFAPTTVQGVTQPLPLL